MSKNMRKQQKLWSVDETEFLKDNFESKGSSYCARALGRTLSSVSNKAYSLNLRSNKARPTRTDQEYKELLKPFNLINLEQYVTAKIKITHRCIICDNVLNAVPAEVLRGKTKCGCSSKQRSGFNEDAPALLYYVRMTKGDKTYYKIGITNRTVKERFADETDKTITILLQEDFEKGRDARTKERELLSKFSVFRVRDTSFLRGGGTELFEADILELDVRFTATANSLHCASYLP